jgi:hypothetical protein
MAVGAALAAALAVAGLHEVDGPAGAAELNHAAVVIDTGDGGQVRRFCLAFPEESITGAEALRRIESEVVFASYGAKGQGVCALCGVGCPAGDCFCDRTKYWAYHRAGPGGAPYQYSRAGVSSTLVRNGDVEGWAWGTGDAPPAATVGEVCDVPEPPVRAAGGGSSTPTTTTTSTTAGTPSEEPPPSAPQPTVPAAGGGGTGPATTLRPGATAPAGPTATTVAATEPVPGPAEVAPAPADEATTTTAVATEDGSGEGDETALGGPPARAGDEDGGPGPLDVLSVAAFVALLGGVLVWRARLRRAADVRPVTPVR